MRAGEIAGCVLIVGLARGFGLQAQEPASRGQSPPPAVKERVRAIEQVIESRSDDSIKRFVHEHLTSELRDAKSLEEWIAFVKEMRTNYGGFGGVQVRRAEDGGMEFRFLDCPAEGTPLHVELTATDPTLINRIRFGEAGKRGSPESRQKMAPLTWDTVRSRLKDEADSGFSGSVLLVRDGEVFLHEAYGLADREQRKPNRPETVFAVGSTPIDFTRGAILKLIDDGKLSLADSITGFFPGVPDDKKKITIEQLMTGRSGLRNFHGRPSDTDADNMWIDRDAAVKRILEDELLFAPGADQAHSHSAFGLLAAIVEIVGGEPYGVFLEKHMFGPAGMKNTSNYEDIRAPDEEVAIGYGGQTYTAINSPKKWGKTSWLVMGSGGMVSTTADLHRWNKAMRDGKLLSPNMVGKYWMPPGGVLMGASDNGFMAAYTEGPWTMMFLLSNDIGRPATRQLIDDLAQLVNQRKGRLGVLLRHEPHRVLVEEVSPDSAAARAGLQAGDQLLAANSRPLEADSAEATLREQVVAGSPLELKIKRGEQTLTLRIVPDPG
jgi:CubicO group peptidase (beta-lactamase class C family)